MSPIELRANAAWLRDLTGCDCPWAIEIDQDLQDLALDLITSQIVTDNLTGAEVRRVEELIRSLDAPEDRARRAKEAEKKVKDRAKLEAMNLTDQEAYLDATFDRLMARNKAHMLYQHGAAARRQTGVCTRNEIIAYFEASSLPVRSRAADTAKKLGLTVQYVRRVLKASDVKKANSSIR